MIRHTETGQWFNKNKNSWTNKWENGTLWQHKTGAIQTMRHYKLDATIANLITFEVKEENEL